MADRFPGRRAVADRLKDPGSAPRQGRGWWPATSRPWAAIAIAAGLCILLPAPGASEHAVAGSNSTSVTFDHDGDNEWWVEVLTQPSSGDQVVAMEVRPESGTFRGLQAKSTLNGWTKWGPETAFRIPPGDRVLLRAHTVDGPTGATGTVTSCWFTHPAGVEQCAAPPPPATWQTTMVGQAGASSFGGDIALADIDNNLRTDVVVGRDQGLYRFEWNGAGWMSERISQRRFDTVAAGDGDNDGSSEAYGMAVVSSGLDLVQYRKTAAGWTQTTMASFTQPMAGDMTLGDIDGQAGREVYVGVYATECDPDPNVPLCSSVTTIYHVQRNPDWWTTTAIATLSGHINSMWIGDGDNNGRFEIYVGHGTRHADRTSQVQSVNGQWVVTGFSGSGSDSGYSLVVAGDGDRDGRNEVYQINWYGVMLQHRYDQVNGWDYEPMFGFEGNPDLGGATGFFIGDADNDGSQELYVAARDSLYRVSWSGTMWTHTRIATPLDPVRGAGGNGILVVGDGDNDARREVYTAFAHVMPNTGEDGVTNVFKVAVATPTFDATFTGVRGNEWWQQVSVSASGGTLSKVDVRFNGGAWQPLTKQSWGGYAASYRAIQGTVVQLRATSTTGATDLSDCYRWIPPPNTDASKVACTAPPPAFDAQFSNVKGNEWWVEAKVTANQPIAKVEARVNCGATWQTLTLQSWGSYAKSFNVPSGSKVDFRATSTSGATDLSGGYIWPQATATGAC